MNALQMKTACALFAMAGIAMTASAGAATDSDAVMTELQHGWAQANYQTPEDQQEKTFEALIAKAEQAVKENPGKPELLAWEAIILSSYAKVQGGFGAMDSVEKARDLLLEAIKIDDKTLGGGVNLLGLADKAEGLDGVVLKDAAVVLVHQLGTDGAECDGC